MVWIEQACNLPSAFISFLRGYKTFWDVNNVIQVIYHADLREINLLFSEKLDHGGVSNRNTTDAETFGEQDGETLTAGVQETLENLQLDEGQGDQNEGDNTGSEDMMDAERIVTIPSYTDFLVVRATHPGQ